MKVTFNHYDLEKAAKNPQKFIRLILEIKQKFGLNNAISALKASGLCINTSKNSNSELCALTLITLEEKSQNKNENLELIKLKNEIKIINDLIQEFHAFFSLFELKNNEPEGEFASLLFSIEIIVAKLLQDTNRISSKEVIGLSKYFSKVEFPGNMDNIHDAHTAGRIVENNITNISTAIKNLLNKKTILNAEYLLTEENFKMVSKHYSLTILWDCIQDIIDVWQYMGLKIHKYRSNYHVNAAYIKEYREAIVSNTRHRMERIYVTNSKLKNLLKDKIIDEKKYKRARMEASIELCMPLFWSKDFSDKYLEVPLSYWLKAYEIIQNESQNFLNSKNSIEVQSLYAWAIFKTKNEWLDIFLSNGVNKNLASIIIDNLTFNKSSKDLYDCPFFKIKNFLMVLPCLTLTIEPSGSLISNLHSKDGSKTRGENFENYIRFMFRLCHINARRVKISNKGRQYECDVCFVINDELFLGECKAYAQPYTLREHYSILKKIDEATYSLNSKAKFYKNNIHFMRQIFKLGSSWTPKKIHRLLILSHKIGGSSKLNDCYITDSTLLDNFLSRNSVIEIIKNGAIEYHSEFSHQGEITASKFIEFLSHPARLHIRKKNYGTINHYYPLGDNFIIYKNYEKKELDFVYKETSV